MVGRNKSGLKKEKLFSGWPDTNINKNGVRISAMYFTPGRKKFADFFAGLCAFAGLALGAFIALEIRDDPNWFIGGGVGGGIGGFFLGSLLGNNFKKRTNIEFTPEVIRVPDTFGFKNYDRNVPHGFKTVLHEKAQQEEEMEINERYEKEVKFADQGKRAPKIHRKPKYYRDSYHVFMEYVGDRIYLAEVYEKKKAEAFLVRLQGADNFMNSFKNIQPADLSEGGGDKGSPFGERPSLDEE